ncbi:hypothetical protein JKA74_07830 [Marivirga sp. S37H4]|uniref:Uncharacterized protein n=1 Tax=Marivirga aurantiaca TaxID=2802615 RepID=A0A935C8G3_9BACT|nr:hypothetical protein [Marivirga aurantiaca]MBK6264942.1 hypothetical protein [Marivirga aurantiaca]
MENFDTYKNQWQSGRKQLVEKGSGIEEIIQLAQKKKRESIMSHYGTIIVLSITFIGLVLFFKYIAPFNELLSHIGMLFMLGGLLVRILAEVFSLMKGFSLPPDMTTEQHIRKMMEFHHLRKKIHGVFTIIILVLYVIGFYLLTPEFSLHIEQKWMILMHISFVFVAVGLYFLIRKSIKDELATLKEWSELQTDLHQS